MKKDWLWDKDISEKKLKEIFSNRDNPRFISLSALLLSRKNSAEEVFKEYIKREDFFIRWQSIKRRMRKNSWNDPRIEYWQAIYETLKKIPKVAELKQPKSSVLKIQEEPLFALSREIGGKIKETRERSGLTQKKLANKLKISQQIISRIESGMRNISLETLDKVCRKLGIFVDAKKFGFTEETQIVTSTRHILPFDQLDSCRFEDLCLWIIQRSNEFDKVERYGGSGDKQRDIVAYKYPTVGKQEMWYFQCKRYKNISFATFKEEIDNLNKYSDKERDFKPDKIVFVTSCPVSPICKDKVKEYLKVLSFSSVDFWDEAKLDEKAKATQGVVEEFFKGGVNTEAIAEKVAKSIYKKFLPLTSLFSNAGLLIAQDKSKKDKINLFIDEAVQNIKSNNIDKAKQILFNVKGKIEDNPVKFKEELARIYNNLGVCYNRLEIDNGDFDEAERYFHLAVDIKPDFIKAKINLASVYLNKGSEKYFEKAYNIAEQLWNQSDKKDPMIFERFIQSKSHHQSPKEAIVFYEGSQEARALVEKDEGLLNFMGYIYFIENNIDKAQELAEQALKLAPQIPHILMLKARTLMARAQIEAVIPSAFEVIPKFKRYEEIEKALGLLEQALEIAEKEKDDYLVNQIRYDRNFCLLWLRRFEAPEYKENRESIDVKRLDLDQRMQIDINDGLIQIEKRNFEIAYEILIAAKILEKLSYKEKARIARIFFLKGAPEQSKSIFKTLELEAGQKRDIQFWMDMSLNEILLGNKNLAIEAAEKAKKFSIGTDKEKIVLSHFNALMLRYASSGEVDRLMTGMFDYDKKYPEDKAIWPVKAIDEKGGLSGEFKAMLLKQKEWYEGVRQVPAPSYYLEQILRMPYAQILSSQNDPEFVIGLTIPNEQFEKELVGNFEKAEQLVFDYASLLNLSKMNLLGYLERFGKQLYIVKELFDKVQYELLSFEQEDLRRLWGFLKSSKEIKIADESKAALKGENTDKLFDKWLVDSMRLAKDKKAVFVVDDLRLLKFLYLEEDIKGCNSYIILKAARAKEWIDGKMYSLSIGALAERFYTFLPFSGNDLFQVVMEDKSKLTRRSYHLINQLFLSGSNAESFTKVFVKFIDLLWKTGSLPEDKINWLGFLSEKILEFIDKQGGVDNNQEFEKVAPDFVLMWITVVQRSNRDEIALLEKEVNKILNKPYLNIFKDNIAGFIQAKKQKLISVLS